MAPSKLWHQFTKIDQLSASCNICKKTIRTSGNTSNLKAHMEKHLQNPEARYDAQNKREQEQLKISKFVTSVSTSSEVYTDTRTSSTNDPDEPDVKKKIFLKVINILMLINLCILLTVCYSI